jgi:hypothetical protein
VSHVKYELGFYIPEDDILHSHCRENLKSYIYDVFVTHSIFSISTVYIPKKGMQWDSSMCTTQSENINISFHSLMYHYWYTEVSRVPKRIVEKPRSNPSLKNGVFWDVTPCGPYKNRRFGGT